MESTMLSSSAAAAGVTRHARQRRPNANLAAHAVHTRRGLLAGIAVPGQRRIDWKCIHGSIASHDWAVEGCFALVMLQMDPAEAIDISMTKVPAAAAEGIKRRDEAMEWRCKGGMFDCDGDRRDYAKKQYKDFLDKNKGK